MRLWMAFLALLPACGFQLPGGHSSDDGGGGEKPPPDANLCFGSYVKVCFDSMADIPTAPAPLPDDATIQVDTGSSPLCNQANNRKNEFCVIAGAGISLATGQSLRGFGSKPLVLLSTTTIDVRGRVDVSSIRNPGQMSTGAGSNPTGMCAGLGEAAGNAGGYGGTFHGQGGGGFAQDGAGGVPSAALTAFPTVLRGGCPGGPGSTALSGGVPGQGGSGGGAVALVAVTSIFMDSEIWAFGSGGRGGSGNTSGGGGGGSGGMVVLEAPSVTESTAAKVFANGGGGGQGGAPPGAPGADVGTDGSESTGPTAPGVGGQDATKLGGRGGDGSVALQLEGTAGSKGPTATPGGGGAGGGGAGFIHAPGVDPTRVSPASQNLPPSS